GQHVGPEAVGSEGGGALVGDGKVGCPRRDDEHTPRAFEPGPPHDGRTRAGAFGTTGEGGVDLLVVGPGEDGRAAVVLGEKLGHEGGALLGRLARRVDGFGQALAQGAVVVDAREAEVGERQAPQAGDGVVGRQHAGAYVGEELAQGRFVHRGRQYPPLVTSVAFLGPAGTFTEEALLSQPDLAEAELVALPSFPDVLRATADGSVDYGFVALENSIEGTVRLVMDLLVFEHDLLIQREVVLPIRQNLLAPPGVALGDVRRVVSFPDALAQCREFFGRELPGVEIVAANSTAEAVRAVAEERPEATAALGTALAAKLYGLEVLAADVEDSDENTTRFVLVGREAIPAPTGHDKTSIVCFQHSDRPGSLHAILGQFTARNINLTRLASRPTKK